jgi:hypothetical protein
VDCSTVSRSTVDGSKVDGSKVDGSKVDGSKVDGSKVDGSTVYGSKVDGSTVSSSKVSRSTVYGAIIKVGTDYFTISGMAEWGSITVHRTETGLAIHCGCRHFTSFKDANKHWVKRKDRAGTRQALKIMAAVVKQRKWLKKGGK